MPAPENSEPVPPPKRSWISDLLGLPPKQEKSTAPESATEPEDHSATEIQYDSEGKRLPPSTDEATEEPTADT